MGVDLTARANLCGRQIDLTWRCESPGQSCSQLRLVRREQAYPTGPDDGLVVFDLADFPNQNWIRQRRTVYLGPGVAATGGVYRAEVRQLFFDPKGESYPAEIWLACYNPVPHSTAKAKITDVTRLVCHPCSVENPLSWRQVETTEIFVSGPEGGECSAGQFVVSSDHPDGTIPDQFAWYPPRTEPSLGRLPDMRLITGQGKVQTLPHALIPGLWEAEIGNPSPARPQWPSRGPVSVSFAGQAAFETTIEIKSVPDLDSGDWIHSFKVTDADLTAQVNYYYTLLDDSGAILGQAAVMATGRYGLAGRLYELLPAVYRSYDQSLPAQQGQGQLRHFLEIFGLTLDQLRSQAEGLRSRHDVRQVRADLLPHLAQWIGWNLDLTLDEISQRNELLFAPEIYRTVGTLPNLQALVNRVTGWDCRIKEFVQNVCLSNAPEVLHLWEIWGTEYDETGQSWLKPEPCTRTEQFDGRPVGLKDTAGDLWLFWPSTRSGLREIWRQRLDDPDSSPAQVRIYPPDDPHHPLAVAESLAVVAAASTTWLFFDAGRPGQREVWGVDLATVIPDQEGYSASNLSRHRADDCHPAAVEFKGQLHLFWQSNRRGPTDIWTQVYNGQAWTSPARVTRASFRQTRPAAVVDNAGVLWLFYGQDDEKARRRLYCQSSTDGRTWDDPRQVTDGPYDDAPAVIFWQGQLWLFWHAQDQNGHWQIWGQTGDGTCWSDPFQVTHHPAADKEPAVIVDSSNRLRVYWRSQRRGYPDIAGESRQGSYPYLSCTVDTKNVEMVAALRAPKAFENRVHFTYDTARSHDDWCARDTVGIYLTPDTEDATLIEQSKDLVEGLINRFLPVQVRVIFVIEPAVYREKVYTYDFPADKQPCFVEEVYVDQVEQVDHYDGPQDNYDDSIPDWVWIRARSAANPDHKTVDFGVTPIVTRYRTWQRGLTNPLEHGYDDSIPDWVWIRAWSAANPDHKTAEFGVTPLVTRYRTWQHD